MTSRSSQEKPSAGFSSRQGQRWTVPERELLRVLWGTCALAVLASRLGRAPGAVRLRATADRLGSPAQGLVSVARLARDTGYATSRLRTAIARLGLRLSPIPTRNPRSLGKGRPHCWMTEGQAAAVTRFLSSLPDGAPLLRHAPSRKPPSMWGRDGRPKACLGHGGREFPHLAKGLCAPCYKRAASRQKAASPVWGVGDRPRACRVHGGTEHPCHAAGVCRRCYHKGRRPGDRHTALGWTPKTVLESSP
jgi:hypothetical protein